MSSLQDDLIPILTKFHREIVQPELQRALGDLRDEMNARFDGQLDAIYQRFDRLETEYQMLVVGLKRLEERMDRLEGRMERLEGRMDRLEQQVGKLALRSELLDLKARVDALQDQVRLIESRLVE